MRAAVDIGSNSIRLLAIDDDGRLLRQEVVETRLGEGFAAGCLTEAAITRTLAVLARFQRELADAQEVIYLATSAVRDAANRDDFLAAASHRLGQPVRLLSGEEEARLTFAGASQGFPFAKDDCCLLDIGGGSTEVAFYEGHQLRTVSVPLGAVRYQVTGRRHDEAYAFLRDELPPLPTHAHYFIGVGGTITAAAAIRQQLTVYRREAVHGFPLNKAALRETYDMLSALPLSDRKQVPGLPPPRADIILFGLDILLILCDLYQIEQLYVSDRGLLDGALAQK